MSPDPLADPAAPNIVTVRRDDLSALTNVVAVAIAWSQVSSTDVAVHDAYARAKEVLDAHSTSSLVARSARG